MSIPSSNTLGYTGLKEANPPNIRYFKRDPTAGDISGFDIGDFWINTVLIQSWQLMNKAAGVASWIQMGSSTAGINVMTGDGGGIINPVAGNITINGINGIQTGNGGAGIMTVTNTNTFIPTVGAPILFVLGNLTVTSGAGLTTSNGGAGILDISPADDLAAVEALATTGVVSRTAANTWDTSTITDHACIVGAAGELLTSVGPLGNGELLIGSVGLDPVVGSLTSVGGSVTITPGAGTINLETGGGIAALYTAEDLSTCSPALNNLNIVGTATNGISTTAAGSTMTIGMATPYADGNFVFQNTVAATPRGVTILNSDNDPGSYSALSVSSRPGGGDAFTLWEIAAGTRFFSMGIDNSDSDLFKFTHNVDPSSGNTIFMVDPAADTFTHYYANILQTQNLVAGGINIIIQNTNNTNIASDAFLRLDVGGANAGDPFIAFLVTGAGKYAMGIDNTVAGDPFKITDGNSPSDGTVLFAMTSAGVITLNNDLDVSEGGTGVSTLISHGILMGNGIGVIQGTAEPTDGQILIGKTADFPQLGSITAGANISVTPGAGSITIASTYAPDFASIAETKIGTSTTKILNPADLTGYMEDLTFTGFVSWAAGAPYFDDTTLGDFELLVGGTGYIKGKEIAWAGGQTESGLAAGNCYWIYIDDSGTIGSATVRTNALFEDYIVLFECLRDSTPITNNQVTVKENHPYNYSSTVSNYQHNVIGTVIENANNGANITLVGTQKVGISGADVLSDHGLDTTIPDSAGAGVLWNKKYTTAAGKWALHNANDTFTGVYNNGGTITALGANKFGVYTLYVSKDSLNAVTPTYFAVPDIAQYNNLAAANLAISNGTTAKATNELLALELAQLGYIIYSQAANAIVSVIIAKATLKQTISTGGTNQAALVNTVVTSFDGWLTAANTNVQSALDTLDDILKAGGAGTVLAGAAGLPTFTATPTVTSITISNAPAAGTDGTNKTYVDTIAAGFDHKDVCVAASTGALTVLYDNGIGGVGATLTNNGALAAFALDGQSPIVGKRVLIKDQATTFQNGIYTVTVVGDGGTAWVLTRATDYDTALEMQNGSLIPVSAGTANVNTMWLQNVTVVDIGTDPVTYQKFQSKPLSSPVAIAEGGTNATAMATTYGVNYFDGTRLVTTAVGTATHVLTSNGAGVAPTFQAIPAQGNVTAAGNITDDYVVTGDGGAKGVQVSSMKIDANGQMTNTTQPAFCAYNSATDTNQTGNSAVVTIDFDTEVYDQNGDFAADTFTAPITGKYALTTNVRTTDLSAAMTAANMDIVTSNRTIRYNWNPYNGSVAGLNSSAVLTTVLDMDANDTAIVQVTIANGAGDTASISGHATFLFTSFSGYLAC